MGSNSRGIAMVEQDRREALDRAAFIVLGWTKSSGSSIL
jgi:hypothetical protein